MISAAHLGVIAASTPRVASGTGRNFWRVYFPNAELKYLRLSEVEMYSIVNGPNRCSGGSASASSTDALSDASNAFDGSGGTYWAAAALSNNAPHWIRYDFASPVEIVQFKLVAESSNFPTACKLQSSADGSTWDDVSALMDARFGEASGSQKFLVGGTKSYWRLYVSANQSGGYTAISELELRGSISGADLTVPAGAAQQDSSSGGFDVPGAFDNNSSTFWQSSNASPPHWIWYAFGEDVDIAQISIRNREYGDRSPKEFKLQYSGDGFNWTDALSVSGQIGWSAWETRVFNV